jgi:hypothetical protein
MLEQLNESHSWEGGYVVASTSSARKCMPLQGVFTPPSG